MPLTLQASFQTRHDPSPHRTGHETDREDAEPARGHRTQEALSGSKPNALGSKAMALNSKPACLPSIQTPQLL